MKGGKERVNANIQTLNHVSTNSMTTSHTRESNQVQGKGQDFNQVLKEIYSSTNKDTIKPPKTDSQVPETKTVSTSESDMDINSSNTTKSFKLEKVKEDGLQEDIEEKDLSQEELEAIISLLQTRSDMIIEDLSQVLNISKEELESLLEESNLSALDLLDTNNLSKFYMHLTQDSNLISLITDESLGAEYSAILDIVKNANQDLNQELMETLDTSDIDIESLLKDLLLNDSSNPADNEGQDLVGLNLDMSGESGDLDPNEVVNKIEPANTSHLSESKSVNLVVDDQREASANTSSKGTNKDLSSDSYGSTRSEVNWNNLNMTINETSNVSQASSQIEDIHDVTLQIIEQVKVKLQDNQQSIEINLHPEHLGKLSLEIASKNGMLTAKFITQNEGTKELIESQMSVLKEQLNLQGLKVEDIEVEVGLSDFFHNQSSDSNPERNKQNQGRKIPNFNFLAEDDLPSEETLDDLLISYEDSNVTNNSVSYLA